MKMPKHIWQGTSFSLTFHDHQYQEICSTEKFIALSTMPVEVYPQAKIDFTHSKVTIMPEVGFVNHGYTMRVVALVLDTIYMTHSRR